MRELTRREVSQVNGGLGPLAIIGIDLALNAALLGYAAVMSNDYFVDAHNNGR